MQSKNDSGVPPRNDAGQDSDGAPLRPLHLCLSALPWLGLLLPFLYARAMPAVFGIPFFYAYQFAWIPVSAILTAIVYKDLKKHDSSRPH